MITMMFRKISFSLIIVIGLIGLAACGNKSKPKDAEETTKPSEEISKPSKESMDTQDPDFERAAMVNVELGLGYLTQGQVARAKTKLTHALKLAPNLAEVRSAMAYFLEMVGDYKDAELEHKKAASLSSAKGAVFNNYGAFLCRRGRFKEADQAFHTAINDKSYPRTAEVYENAGLCAIKWKGQDIKAAEYLTTAIRRDPNRPNAVLELASLELKSGKFREAGDLLARYKSIAEPSPKSLWLGIQVARALNDENSAASQGLMLKNLFQGSPEYELFVNSEKNE